MTDPIEAMAIAYNSVLLNQPEDQRDQVEAMTAAYAALRETLVPVGWQYDCTNPVGDRNHLDPTFLRLGRRANMDPRFWTETPLYALPEIKP